MRKSFILLGTAAIVALSLSSCNRTEIENPSDSTFTRTVRINASFGTDTKTSIVEGDDAASFKWSADDASRFSVKENTKAGTDIELSLSEENTKAVISAVFDTDPDATSFVYNATLAANKTGSGNPKIPAVQNPTESSFDPDADILVAKPLTFDSAQDELNMKFARPVVINKMTLKGLRAGETVSAVKIAGDKELTGSFSPSSESWTKQDSEITVNVNRTVPASGELAVYFITMPVDGVTLTITATSADYVYSKTLAKTISFVENKVTVFGVKELAEEEKEDYSGTYVLVNAEAKKMADVWKGGNNLPAIDITQEDGVIYYDPDAAVLSNAQIEVTRITDEESEYYNMYTMVQNGKYLYAPSAESNYLKGQNEPDVNAYWEISCTDEGAWSIVAAKSTNRNVLQNNGSLFACYASAAQTAVALFGTDVVKPTPVITLSSNSIALESEAVSALDIDADFNSNTSVVSAKACDDEDCTTLSSWLNVSIGSGNAVLLSAEANETDAERTGYIEITAANSEGRTVKAVVAVTQNYAGGAKTYTLDFESITNKVSVYTSTWAQVCNGFEWTISNFNNNNGGWKFIRCGSKNNASVATITTASAIPEAIGTIDLDIQSIKAASVNSITLLVDASNSFNTSALQTITCEKTQGTQQIVIPIPTENCYYKLVFDCLKDSSSNGFVQVGSVVYTEAIGD